MTMVACGGGALLMGGIICVLSALCCQPAAGVELTAQDRDDDWIVTTIPTGYFARLVHYPDGSTRFQGFIVDMVKWMAVRLGKNYQFRLVEDGRYGSYDQTRSGWNGMIGEVISGKADLAAAPLTITAPRKAVVSFSEPFMSFPTVIIVSRSTAGQSSPTLRELLDQPDIKFIAVAGGSTQHLIRYSTDPDMARLAKRLDGVNTTDQGVTRARTERTAFMMEGSMAEQYLNQEPCDLVKVDLLELPLREYGLALRKGSPDLGRVNEMIRVMKEQGVIELLKAKSLMSECQA